MAHRRGIDHVLIVVHNIESARRSYSALGFAPGPYGSHFPLATANYTVTLNRTYFELMGIVDPSRDTRGYEKILAARECLAAVFFDSVDIDDDYRRLVNAGIEAPLPADFRNRKSIDGREVVFHWRSIRLFDERTPFLRFGVTQCQTPELVWNKTLQAHPNGAREITTMTIAADDPDALRPRLAALFGEETIARDGRALCAGGPPAVVRVIPRAELSERYPGSPPLGSDLAPIAVALDVEIASGSQLAAILSASGVSHTAGADGTLRVPPSHAHGVWLDFHPAP